MESFNISPEQAEPPDLKSPIDPRGRASSLHLHPNFANATNNPNHLTFDAFYGAHGKGNSADANALGKCVSALTQQSTNAQTKADVTAAKTCKAELAASKANFATAYGAGRNAFGVCVARHSKL